MGLFLKPFQLVREKGFLKGLQISIWHLKISLEKFFLYNAEKAGFPRYSTWLKSHDAPLASLERQRIAWQDFPFKPKICFVVHADGINPKGLTWTLESILAQIYPTWDALVMLPDDPTTQSGLELKKHEFKDSRIRWQVFQSAVCRPELSIQALSFVNADYVLQLAAGDTLSADFAFELATRINHQPDGEILYCDEDRYLREPENRQEPKFWPDWSPELLVSENYLKHAAIKQTLLVEGIQNEACQEYGDLIFWVSENAKRIIHIPRILVHCPSAPEGQTGLAKEQGDYCRYVEKHLNRKGIEHAIAVIKNQELIHASWPVKAEKVSIIIPTQDRVGYLKRCIDSILRKTSYADYELVLVENSSREEETFRYYEQLRKDPRIKIVKFDGKFNFNAANNLGASAASGNHFLFLNNDVEIITPDWIEELVRWAEIPEIGVVGAKLLLPDRRIQHAGIVVGMEGHASHIFGGLQEGYRNCFGSTDWYRNYSAVTGACMILRREVFNRLEGFDENFTLVFSDIDICQRAILLGYRVVYNPFVELYHYEGKTRSRYIPEEDMRTAYDRLKELIISGDPYYNPNLTTAIRKPVLRRSNEEAPLARLDEIMRAV